MMISSLCTREVVCIPATADLVEMVARMCDEHVGALVVVSIDAPPRVIGIVTDRDLALDVIGRPGPMADLTAGDLAKSPPVAVLGTDSLQAAARLMEKSGVRRLLVVDKEGSLIGLVSAEDLLAAISEELAGLVRALRSNIRRERGERSVIPVPKAARPVFPSFGTLAPAQ